MGINPFFMVHGYNIPLLDYDIGTAANIKNRGARTPVEIRNKILKKLRETFNFTQAVIAYAQDIQ